jgi:hypothetical protein
LGVGVPVQGDRVQVRTSAAKDTRGGIKGVLTPMVLHRRDMASPADGAPVDLVSAAAAATILHTPHLRRLLLPEGLLPSPYTVLAFDATVMLHDPLGLRATFGRHQTVRFCQDGVGAILDHVWGDGIALTDYWTDAGRLIGSIQDGPRRHLVLALGRRTRRGELLSFQVRRRAMAAFLAPEEWVATVVDHPVQQLRRTVVFPRERPCQLAVLEVAGGSAPACP